MEDNTNSVFVKVLETDSLSDIALIKSVLDDQDITYFLQGENMKFIRPVDPVLLMVASEDVEKVVALLKTLKFNYSPLLFGK